MAAITNPGRVLNAELSLYACPMNSRNWGTSVPVLSRLLGGTETLNLIKVSQGVRMYGISTGVGIQIYASGSILVALQGTLQQGTRTSVVGKAPPVQGQSAAPPQFYWK